MFAMMDRQNKIITFWSPVSGVGTTFTAINMAKIMGEKGAKVLLFDLDLKTPATHIYLDNKDNVHCIDNIIPFTAGGRLSSEVVETNVQKGVKDFFDYLRGTNTPNQAHYIAPESIDCILETAVNMYDYIIIDTHSIIDNAGTYIALKNADLIFMVTEKNAIIIQQYDNVKNLVIKTFDMEKFRLVINKEQKNVYMASEDVGNYYGMKICCELPLLEAEFINAINQGKWLTHLYGKDKNARRYVKEIERLIQGEIAPNLANSVDTKKTKLSFFRK